MQFTLFYRGPLKSNARPAEKHAIRRHFHLQLKALWDEYPLSEYRSWLQPADSNNRSSVLRNKHGFVFAPLVCEHMRAVAELDIRMLWPQSPGAIVSNGGDIDNRLKTLFDALKCPSEPTALPESASPSEDEDPFFCLLEDDRLIGKISVEADRLLEKGLDQTEVAVLIKVSTRNLGDGWDALP